MNRMGMLPTFTRIDSKIVILAISKFNGIIASVMVIEPRGWVYVFVPDVTTCENCSHWKCYSGRRDATHMSDLVPSEE